MIDLPTKKKSLRRDCRLSRYPPRGAVTLVELIVLLLLFLPPLLLYPMAGKRWGNWAGIGIASAVEFALLTLVILFYRWGSRRFIERFGIQRLPNVYRIQATPTDPAHLVVADGASISVGDYGWEAEPIESDGLTYLHGLNKRWEVVWYAGFRSDEIEKVATKLQSQYLIPYTWRSAGSNAPPCPYPVKKLTLRTLGYAEPIIDRSVQGKSTNAGLND
jgi:hypothetical protein